MNKTEELKKVLDGQRSAYYIGGTLCLDDGPHFVLCNIEDVDNTPEEAYLIACIYLQNKTPNHTFWDRALAIKNEREEKS